MKHPDERRPWHDIRYPHDPEKQYQLQKLTKQIDEIEATQGREAAEKKWAESGN